MKTVFTFYYFLKKNLFALFLGLLAIILFAAAILRAITPRAIAPKQATTVVQAPNTWQAITPNSSTLNDVYQSLGQPIKTEKTNQGTMLSYESVFPAQPNQVTVGQQQKVAFIKEYTLHANGGNIKDYIAKFHSYDLAMVDAQTGEGDTVYIFLSKGIAIVAHNGDGSVEQRWYFTPTDQATFLKTWGQHLSFNENPNRF